VPRDVDPGARRSRFDWRGIAADAAEKRWYAYAWPIHAGDTGIRSFYVDQDGDIFTTADLRAGPPVAPPSRDGRRWTVMP
jgi:hypothetical protein